MKPYRKDSLSAQARGRKDMDFLPQMVESFRDKLIFSLEMDKEIGQNPTMEHLEKAIHFAKRESTAGSKARDLAIEEVKRKYNFDSARKDSYDKTGANSKIRVTAEVRGNSIYMEMFKPNGEKFESGTVPMQDLNEVGNRFLEGYELKGLPSYAMDSARKDGLSASSRTGGRRFDATKIADTGADKAQLEKELDPFI